MQNDQEYGKSDWRVRVCNRITGNVKFSPTGKEKWLTNTRNSMKRQFWWFGRPHVSVFHRRATRATNAFRPQRGEHRDEEMPIERFPIQRRIITRKKVKKKNKTLYTTILRRENDARSLCSILPLIVVRTGTRELTPQAVSQFLLYTRHNLSQLYGVWSHHGILI